MKILSIITPCLNIIKDGREVYFHKMMESVHNQSYKNIEHIVIDGGSNDGTVALLESYKNKGWITKIISEKDTGIYNALNKGIKLAKGSYINIMNTDDYFLDLNFFKKGIEKLEKLSIDFVHADKIIKSKDGKKDAIKKGNKFNSFFRMPFRHQTMIVRKEVFDKVGLFDERYKIASDYKWVMKMILANKKGFRFSQITLCSLDGGISSDRSKCIEEVSIILFETYGNKYKLTLEECKAIYLRKISFKLLFKVLRKVKNWKIKSSLIYCYFLKFKE